MTETPASPVEPPPRDPRQPADFDPIALGKTMLRTIRVGSLGTLDCESGHPFVTLTSVATDFDGTPIILVSRLSTHTGNLLAEPRASLMLSQGGKGDPLAHPRLTLQVNARQVAASSEEAGRLRHRFLARHPKAQLYVDFPDFLFFRLDLARIHLNGGFARAFDGVAQHILTPVEDMDAFAALAASALDHLNDDHAEALSLYATALCGMAPGRWRASGLDPEGLDLTLGDQTARVTFSESASDALALRRVLKNLAESARDQH